jgi:hypothetical protein
MLACASRVGNENNLRPVKAEIMAQKARSGLRWRACDFPVFVPRELTGITPAA